MISYILAVLVALLAVGADQYTKYYIAANFAENESKELLGGIIDITYIHNDGAAWGMMKGHTWLLISITVVVMLVCFALLLKYGVKDKLMFWAVTLILSGGIGNMIDRIFRDGKVVDFLQFAFYKEFPIFNVADCAIVIGAAFLVLYFMLGILSEYRQKRKKPLDETVIKNEQS